MSDNEVTLKLLHDIIVAQGRRTDDGIADLSKRVGKVEGSVDKLEGSVDKLDGSVERQSKQIALLFKRSRDLEAGQEELSGEQGRLISLQAAKEEEERRVRLERLESERALLLQEKTARELADKQAIDESWQRRLSLLRKVIGVLVLGILISIPAAAPYVPTIMKAMGF